MLLNQNNFDCDICKINTKNIKKHNKTETHLLRISILNENENIYNFKTVNNVLKYKENIEEIKDYELGDSREHLTALSARIRKSDKKSSTIKMYEKAMIEILESGAEDDAKKEICRELSLWGTKRCIPALEQLKADKDCGAMAEYALERIQG